MTRTVWGRLAQSDLARIDAFNAEHDRDYADRVGAAAVAAGRFLAEFPQAGSVVDRERRKWRVPGTDYVLIYRVVSTGVQILRVHHGRENWRLP